MLSQTVFNINVSFTRWGSVYLDLYLSNVLTEIEQSRDTIRVLSDNCTHQTSISMVTRSQCCHNIYQKERVDIIYTRDTTLTLYADGRSLRSCWKDDPHSGCWRLLQPPVTVRYLSSPSQLPELRGIKKQSESEIEILSCCYQLSLVHGFVLEKYFLGDEWRDHVICLDLSVQPGFILKHKDRGRVRGRQAQ